jgi:hypothetical protein
MPATNTSNFVAGAYSMTYAPISSSNTSTDCGLIRDGFYLTPTIHQEAVTVDRWGQSVVDTIIQGGNYTLTFALSEYAKALTAGIVRPFDSVADGTWSQIGTAGSQNGGKIILAPYAYPGNMAQIANTNLKTYTFPLCVPNGDHGAFNLNTNLRVVECSFMILTNASTGVGYTTA